MRFDYFGSGDSYGVDRDVTLDSIVVDTHAAIEEFREIREATPLALVGYRLGAVPALIAARDTGCRVVLVDPVLDGPKWLRLLESDPWAGELDDGAMESGGFAFGRALRETLEHRSPLVTPPDGPEVASVVISGDGACPFFPAEKVEMCEAAPTWRLSDGVGSATIPSKLVDIVVERVRTLGEGQL
jgi:hypothetical protein